MRADWTTGPTAGGGVNHFHFEVEEVLSTHPGVADVAVIGVPDERTGERVCAVIVAQRDETVTLRSLFEHCQHSGLSKHKSPECIQFVDELPRNSTGKVLKTELRERFCRRQTEEKP